MLEMNGEAYLCTYMYIYVCVWGGGGVHKKTRKGGCVAYGCMHTRHGDHIVLLLPIHLSVSARYFACGEQHKAYRATAHAHTRIHTQTYLHTHTHAHIYVYVRIFKEGEREMDGNERQRLKDIHHVKGQDGTDTNQHLYTHTHTETSTDNAVKADTTSKEKRNFLRMAGVRACMCVRRW